MVFFKVDDGTESQTKRVKTKKGYRSLEAMSVATVWYRKKSEIINSRRGILNLNLESKTNNLRIDSLVQNYGVF